MLVTLPRESLRSSQQVLLSVMLFVLSLLIIALLALICITRPSRWISLPCCRTEKMTCVCACRTIPTAPSPAASSTGIAA